MSRVCASSFTGLLAESFPEIRTGKTILMRFCRRFPFPKEPPMRLDDLPVARLAAALKGHTKAKRNVFVACRIMDLEVILGYDPRRSATPMTR